MFEFKEVDYHNAVIFFDDFPCEQVCYSHKKTLDYVRFLLDQIIDGKLDYPIPHVVHVWEPLENNDFFYLVSSFHGKVKLKRLSFEGSASLFLSNIDRIIEFNSWVCTYGNNASWR